MKKLYLLTVGALVNDPLIKWMTENFIHSKIHEYFDIVWVITVPNEKRKQDCIFQTREAPFKVNILVDPLSRTNRVESMRQLLLKMPLNSLIWSIPEGAIVDHNVGTFLKNTINNINQSIVPDGDLCKGVDHMIFYRPPDGLLNDANNTEKYFNENRKDPRNLFISLDDLYLTRGAKTDLERACVISNSVYL